MTVRPGDRHGNEIAREGIDRCWCGAKYWEKDICVSCGEHVRESLNHVPSIAETHKLDAPSGSLWHGLCSCSWMSNGIESESGAWKSARQHSDTKNDKENS